MLRIFNPATAPDGIDTLDASMVRMALGAYLEETDDYQPFFARLYKDQRATHNLLALSLGWYHYLLRYAENKRELKSVVRLAGRISESFDLPRRNLLAFHRHAPSIPYVRVKGPDDVDGMVKMLCAFLSDENMEKMFYHDFFEGMARQEIHIPHNFTRFCFLFARYVAEQTYSEADEQADETHRLASRIVRDRKPPQHKKRKEPDSRNSNEE